MFNPQPTYRYCEHFVLSTGAAKKPLYYHIKGTLLHRKEKSGFDDFSQAHPYRALWADIINA